MFSDICQITHSKLVYGTCPWCGRLIVEGQAALGSGSGEGERVGNNESPPGPNLLEVVNAAGPLPPPPAAQFVAEIAEALQQYHARGKVHGAVRPVACRLTADGHIRLHAPSDSMASTELVDLSIADFLAPEQALSSIRVDPRADVYSLGCLLYFLLVGHPPFPAGSVSERLIKHQIEPPPAICNLRPDVPKEIEDICTKMMAKRPDQRFPNAQSVAEALREWLTK